MGTKTILELMPLEDRNDLLQRLESTDPETARSAAEVLETCLALELENPVPGTEEATAARVLASFERALGLDHENQPANAIVAFDRSEQPEEVNAILAFNRLLSSPTH